MNLLFFFFFTRLNGLTLLAVHGQVHIQPDEVIDFQLLSSTSRDID